MISKYRKGSESLANGYVIAGIIAGLIIVLVLTGFWKKIDFIVYVIGLIGFQTASPEGNGIIGLNLVSGNLEYYTGEAFKTFYEQDLALLAGYEFNIKDTSSKLSSFYFDTPRRPEILILEINNWRYWIVSLGKSFDTLGVIAFTKKGYVGPTGESYLIDEKNGYALSGFAKIDSLEPSKPIEKIIEWRDSILQGNKCEKFLTLRVKEKGIEKDLTYTVRRVDRHLIIDLTKPIRGTEKWMNVNCFGFVNYKDEDRGSTNLTVYIQFADAVLENKRLTFSFNPVTGWNLPNTLYDPGLFSSERSRYSIAGDKYNLFKEGLYTILETGKDDISSFVVGVGNPSNLDLVYEKDVFTKEDLKNNDKIVYEILGNYSRILTPTKVN